MGLGLWGILRENQVSLKNITSLSSLKKCKERLSLKFPFQPEGRVPQSSHNCMSPLPGSLINWGMLTAVERLRGAMADGSPSPVLQMATPTWLTCVARCLFFTILLPPPPRNFITPISPQTFIPIPLCSQLCSKTSSPCLSLTCYGTHVSVHASVLPIILRLYLVYIVAEISENRNLPPCPVIHSTTLESFDKSLH